MTNLVIPAPPFQWPISVDALALYYGFDGMAPGYLSALSAHPQTFTQTDPRFIPYEIWAGLERYVVLRIHPGSFLTAVLEDRLARAALWATPHAWAAVPALVAVCRDFPSLIPSAAWGSPEHVEAWLTGSPEHEMG